MRTINLSQTGVLFVLLIAFVTFRTDENAQVKGLYFKIIYTERQTFNIDVTTFNDKLSPES
jgi:hypothetical protein